MMVWPISAREYLPLSITSVEDNAAAHAGAGGYVHHVLDAATCAEAEFA